MARPLEGLRVIDVGTRIGAPFCAGLLGEWGAEVVKVEQPRAGDFMRTIGPFVDGYSLFWAVEGRGRKSVTCDLRQPEGQDLFRRLASTADVVCENFRPGTMEEWGIGPDALDPRLVFVRISAFGQDGPYSQRPGLDRLGVAYGGLLHLTGEADRPPVRPGVTVADYLTGVFAAEAALAALYRRDAGRATTSGEAGTGQGAVVDASLYGSVLRILEWTIPAYDRLGTIRSREGNRLSNSAPLDNYPTADGNYVCVVAGGDANFARLCRAMGRGRACLCGARRSGGDRIHGPGHRARRPFRGAPRSGRRRRPGPRPTAPAVALSEARGRRDTGAERGSCLGGGQPCGVVRSRRPDVLGARGAPGQGDRVKRRPVTERYEMTRRRDTGRGRTKGRSM
jgi:crotonobetainyl-CoA:carnitine CoA-transferase CaiB-like acyl-CoA transferase